MNIQQLFIWVATHLISLANYLFGKLVVLAQQSKHQSSTKLCQFQCSNKITVQASNLSTHMY